MIDPGTYPARVVKTEFTESSKGTPALSVTFLVNDGEKEHKVYRDLWLTEKAMKIANKSLKAMGFDIDARDMSELDEDPVLLNGAEVELVIEHEEHNDITRPKVIFINSTRRTKKAEGLNFKTLTKKVRMAGEEIPF